MWKVHLALSAAGSDNLRLHRKALLLLYVAGFMQIPSVWLVIAAVSPGLPVADKEISIWGLMLLPKEAFRISAPSEPDVAVSGSKRSLGQRKT